LRHVCHSLTGLDIFPKTIVAAKADLAEFSNVEIVQADIREFARPESFDVVFSVLTFMHVQDKRLALQCIVDPLRRGGRLILSIDTGSNQTVKNPRHMDRQ